MSTVPGNKLADRIARQKNEQLRPDPNAKLQVPCLIVSVYDSEKLLNTKLPEKVRSLQESAPGLLFAEVMAGDNGKRYILPFKESEDQIYSTYGNYAQIEGRLGVIECQYRDLSRGKLYIRGNINKPSIDMDKAKTTYDIGYLT